MKFSIVIPTYNHCNDFLKPCIESIFQYSNLYDIELIVSANGCTDNTLDYLQSLQQSFNNLGLQKNFKFIWNDNALGYAGACNEGIKSATTNLIILLNNDTVLLPQDKNHWLHLLERPFTLNDKCGISCIVKLFSTCAGSDFAVFFCVMIHKKVFDKIGLLSLDYGIGGGEDTEFSIECQKAGFEILECIEKNWSNEIHTFIGTFPLYHKGEGTLHDKTLVGNSADGFFRNSVTLAKKYNRNWLAQYKLENLIDIPTTSPIDIKDKLKFLSYQNAEAYHYIVSENVYQLDKSVLENKSVLDIGANVGIFSIYCAELNAKQVFAIEPVLASSQLMIDNLTILGYNNVRIDKRIVTSTSNLPTAIKIVENNNHNSLYAESNINEIVPSVTLKELLRFINDREIIVKINCEGSEFDILLTADEEDMACIDRIIVKINLDKHPLHKGFEILSYKLSMHGFNLVDVKQMFNYEFDQYGNVLKNESLPFRIEVWKK